MSYTNGLDNPTEYFSVNTWTADDTTPRSFTGFGHQPDLLWHTHRGSAAINHTITDSVRGGDKQLTTVTNAAEDTKSHGEVTAFGSDGITVEDGTSATYPKLYFNDLDPFGASVGGEYVCWSWKETADAGFDIVSYTGDGTVTNISHSLSAVPELIIAKDRDATSDWVVYHHTQGNGKHLDLNNDEAVATDANAWDETTPTSSVFTVGENSYTNPDSRAMIYYLFAPKQGFSKFGSYTGNGNADGPFLFFGFSPSFIMFKRTDSTGHWVLKDNKRDTYNVATGYLYANDGAAESTSYNLDFTANGVKLRGTDLQFNASGGTYIYMAFAEAPFVNSNGVPCNAR